MTVAPPNGGLGQGERAGSLWPFLCSTIPVTSGPYGRPIELVPVYALDPYNLRKVPKYDYQMHLD